MAGDIVTAPEMMAAIAEHYAWLVQLASRYAVYAAVDAHDIVHNVVASVATRVDDPDKPPIRRTGPNTEIRYLAKSIVRGGIMQMRREQVRQADSLDERYGDGQPRLKPVSNDTPLDEHVAGWDTVRQAVTYLAERNLAFADAFYCVVIQDEDCEEYAKRTAQKYTTVRTRLHRAKRMLREAYANGELAHPLAE